MARSDDISPLGGIGGRLRRGHRRDVEMDQAVAAPPQEVWRLVSDVGRIAEWWPRAIDGAVVEGEEIGREQVVRFEWGRREGRVRQKVTQWEPGVRYGWRVVSEAAGDRTLPPIASINVTITIHRDGPTARVAIHGSFEPIGPRGALALRSLARVARQTYRRALRNLDQSLAPK